MKNNDYPTWLVSLEIAKELKAIGFDTPCSFYYDEKLFKISPWHDEEFVVTNWNDKLFRYCVSIPTWEQVFEWFRARGYKIAFKDINIGTQCAFYHLDIKEGHTFSHFAQKYEKARGVLVMKLIEVHKEFGNNIKRK
nr:MAG TPA: hypothetical protein [Caudoviricetes sp.]